MKKQAISHLFLDIGGVLGTNGWDHLARKRAALHFDISFEEMENLHHLAFGPFEEGKLSLSDYLKWVVFTKKRSFSQHDFEAFMFRQSIPYKDMLACVATLKKKYKLPLVALSNEGKELNDYRIKKFKLKDIFDLFISSSIVGIRKPDPRIWQLALEIAQATPANTLYIENTPLFVDVAATLGIQTLLHKEIKTTKMELKRWGLVG